jgi:hypothetical protein
MAGYSGKPLSTKLGVAPGSLVLMLGGPDEIFAELSTVTAVSRQIENAAVYDVILMFLTRAEEILTSVEDLLPSLIDRGGLWLAWPKKTSKVPTDITENTLRDILLPSTPLVDNKVCAIDDTWSGLRFVRRRKPAGKEAQP